MSRIRWGSGPDGPDVARRFLEAGPDVRPADFRHPTAEAAYTELALGLLRGRTHDILLAESSGKPTARAAVATSTTEPDTALLGLYEARGDAHGDDATQHILDAACGWAHERGCRRLLAPVDGSTWMAYRFLIPDADGDGDPRRFSWEPTHPPRYLDRFRNAGFRESLEYETLGLVFPSDAPYRLADAEAQTRPAADAAHAAGYRFHALHDHREALPWPELHSLSSRAFSLNPLFEPLPLEAFQGMYGSAMGDAAAAFTHWIRDDEGTLCAVIFAFREGDAVVVKSVAVDPAHRGRHLSTALVHLMLAEAVPAGVEEIISALVRTGNASEFLSRRHLMPGVRTWRRGYAVLERAVAP